MSYPLSRVSIILAASVACASGPRAGVTEWHEPPGTLLGGPVCADPSPVAMHDVVAARLAPLERIILGEAPVADKIAAVRTLEPAFEDFMLAEIAACRLLERNRLTVDQYDTFLDSVAVRLPLTDSSERLSAPYPVRPRDGSVFSRYPRRTTLEWTAVSGAMRYVVEVQGLVRRMRLTASGERTELPSQWSLERGGLHAYVLSGTAFRFEFVGAQPGRWRVRGVDRQGRAGPASPWQTFQYTR